MFPVPPPQPTQVTLTMIGSEDPGFPRYGWEGRDMHPHPTLNPRMRLIKYPINVSWGVSAQRRGCLPRGVCLGVNRITDRLHLWRVITIRGRWLASGTGDKLVYNND